MRSDLLEDEHQIGAPVARAAERSGGDDIAAVEPANDVRQLGWPVRRSTKVQVQGRDELAGDLERFA